MVAADLVKEVLYISLMLFAAVRVLMGQLQENRCMPDSQLLAGYTYFFLFYKRNDGFQDI